MTKEQTLLEWVQRSGPLLEIQVLSSGLERQLNNLRRKGIVEMIDHPTVKDAAGYPVRAVALIKGADHIATDAKA